MNVLVRDGLRVHTVRRVASRAIRAAMGGTLQTMGYPGDQTRFMCVRHPQDRLVSAWAHFRDEILIASPLAPGLEKLGYHKYMRFSEFLGIALRRHYADQHTSFQVERMGPRGIDLLCHYEKLDEAWECLRVVHPFLKPLEHIGKTEHDPWMEQYTQTQGRMVRFIFAEDLALYTRAVKEYEHGRRSDIDTSSPRIDGESGVPAGG